MADLVEEIESAIASVKTAIIKQSVGVIREIGDGVARVEGLADVMLNEMLWVWLPFTALWLLAASLRRFGKAPANERD